MKTKIEIEVDIPERYEATSEYRVLSQGDKYIDHLTGKIKTWQCERESDQKYLIVRPVEKWVPIDLSKVTLDMLPMRARFRDLPNEKWNACGLAAFTTERADRFCDETGTYWGYCEVLEEAK